MNKFLFELGTEEVPAEMIAPALKEMTSRLEELLVEAQVPFGSIESFSSPRRLVLVVNELAEEQPSRVELVLGPPRSVGLDAEGRATKAAEGFARKVGITADQLEQIETERGPYLGYRQTLPGKPVTELLGQFLPSVIQAVRWPRTMYWEESRFRFIRPLRWFVALWNSEVLPFEFEGIRAGRISRGHRFLGSAEVEIDHPDHYVKRLRDQYVLVDLAERRSKIEAEMAQATPSGLRILPDPKLQELVAYLNEYPSVIRGEFDRSFIEVPQEVLITVMRHHQKYFAVVEQSGELAPYFLTVLNTSEDAGGNIKRGHERVLKARLQDAVFFWRGDQKKTLESRVDELKKVMFQQQLGSYFDKTERLIAICAQLSESPDLQAAARLCKADLTTEMVFEMTELQGVMGGLYARRQGQPETVWKAVYEHYLPVSLEDDSPSTREGALLSIADRIDTVVGCFGINLAPTGSNDPFALRRQAQGLIKILLDHRLDYSLRALVETAQKNFEGPARTPGIRDQVMDFLLQRVRFIFQEQHIAYDVLNAVVAAGVERVDAALERARALQAIKVEPEFEALAQLFKRIRNILAKQPVDCGAIVEADLQESAEKELYRKLQQMRPDVEKSLAQGDYLAALRELAGLRPGVDRFFDDVMVMAEEPALRKNRLRLLQNISDLVMRIADISEIVR